MQGIRATATERVAEKATVAERHGLRKRVRKKVEERKKDAHTIRENDSSQNCTIY